MIWLLEVLLTSVLLYGFWMFARFVLNKIFGPNYYNTGYIRIYFMALGAAMASVTFDSFFMSMIGVVISVVIVNVVCEGAKALNKSLQ